MDHDTIVFETCLRDRRVEWKPHGRHRFAEIYHYATEPRCVFRDDTLFEEDVPGWIRQESYSGRRPIGGLRFLVAPGQFNLQKQIPISAEVYESLVDIWHMPPLLFRVLTKSLPAAARFTPLRLPSGGGLILRNDRAQLWEFAIAIAYDLSSSMTYAICMGLSTREIDLVFQCLAASQQFAHHFLLLPMILLDFSIEELGYYIQGRRASVEEIQQSTGLDLFLNPSWRRRFQDLSQVDLLQATRVLTSALNSIANLVCYCRTESHMIELVRQLLRGDPEIATQARDLVALPDPSRLFHARLEYLDQCVISALDEIKYLQGSINAQLQTIHGFIAQRDNVINNRSAEASREIADESRHLAALSRRDSADMRIIGVVTLIFLPGTFTATLFSSSFFDFQPPENPRVVSSWIWLYWLVTLVLMFVVLTVSYHFSTRLFAAGGVIRPSKATKGLLQ